jgi:Flp pilus assembly protein TadD
VWVLFFALARMTGAPGRSAFAAALFAVHPLHVESVAWLAERKDVLCALFWFLAIAAYAGNARRPRRSLRVAVLAFTALALMSKPMAVTLPLTLLLLDFWPLRRDVPGRAVNAIMEKAPLLVLAAVSSVLTVMAQRAAQSISTIAAVPLGQRLANAAVSLVGYLVKTVWPVRLAAFYPHPGASLPAWMVAGSVGVLVLISAAAIHARRSRPYLLFGWLWYLVTLLPVIGLVQVGEQGMADRYTYVPLVGIFVALSWGAYNTLASRFVRAAPAVAVAVVVSLIGITRYQVGFWKDGEALFTRALAVTERNDVAHSHLGLLRAKQGRLDEADAHFREALRIRPSDALTHLDLGTNLAQQGKTDAALIEFRVALQLAPNDPRVHTNLGGAYELRDDLDAARSQFDEALRLDPGFSAAHIGLGTVASRGGRLEDAVAQFREAIRLDPANAEAHARAGTALAQLGRNDEAYGQFAEAIRIDPRQPDTQCDWGTALAAQARYREAASHFAEAIRLAPTHARAHFSLAAASFFLEDYAGAWREAHLANRYGLQPPPGFLAMLSAKMPEPR